MAATSPGRRTAAASSIRAIRRPRPGKTYQNATLNHRVYFHKLGTAQAADRLIYATPGNPKLSHYAQVSDDGRWLVISTSLAGDENDVHVVDLRKPGAKPIALFTGLKNQWNYVGNEGSRFYFSTDKDAPLKQVVAVDASRRHRAVSPSSRKPRRRSTGVSLIGGKLIASYLVDAKSGGSRLRAQRPSQLDDRAAGHRHRLRLRRQDFRSGDLLLPSPASTGRRPSTAMMPRPARRANGPCPSSRSTPTRFQSSSASIASKDGTRVPMFIVRKKGTSGPAPTLLYGYGGFNISVTPSFNPANVAWIERGGVFVVANIRGGSEYGNAWHDAGRLAHKQNVFDDFIAAGEYLKANGIAAPKGLAAIGRSNGGLLVGAVTNERPDLFDAVSPGVGVMDMLRFDKFTAGRYWVDDYGHPDRRRISRRCWPIRPITTSRAARLIRR